MMTFSFSGLTDTAATLQKEAILPSRPVTPPPLRPLSLATPKQVLNVDWFRLFSQGVCVIVGFVSVSAGRHQKMDHFG